MGLKKTRNYFANPEDEKGLNPFEPVEFACNQHPDIFQAWLKKVQNVDLIEYLH